MPSKDITGWLVVDWRDGSHRTRQSKPSASELRTNELIAELQIDVDVPDVDIPTLAVEIDVPEPRVHAATLEALDDEDLPNWTDVADDVLERNIDRIQEDDPTNMTDVIHALVGETLVDADARPDPDQVREYIADFVFDNRHNDNGDGDGDG
jgi:Asp-tRNA(Asn)/Glu-tRNA(Gln) amidotransferase B subunit